MAITRRGTQIFKLAADAKPTASDVQAGTELINSDDRHKWVNNGTEWIAQEFPAYKEFRVFKEGANTFITDSIGKVVQGPNTDTADAVNDQLATMGLNSVWKFLWDATSFTIENPIIFPTINATNVKKVVMEGQGFVGTRATTTGATNLQPSATFPLNRYVFELNNPGASTTTTGLVEINNMQCTNSANYTREVGFAKFECGSDVNALQDGIVVNTIYTQYLWRTLDLSGHLWFSRFENIQISSPNAAFVGDTDILIHDGGHVHATNPTPKQNLFYRLRVSRGESHLNSSIRMQSGGYNVFRDCFIDGYEYGVAAIDMNNTDTLTTSYNHFDNVQCLDLMGTPTPDNRKAAVYMAGNCLDNWFVNCRLMNAPAALVMEGTGVQRNVIEMDSWWGGATKITDTGTDGTNVVIVKGGAKTVADVPIVHTGGMSKIIDQRRGAANGGQYSLSGDGTTVAFNIPHGLFATPSKRRVQAASDDARGSFKITAAGTNITLTYPIAPPTGGGNLTWDWSAEVYR